MGEDNGPSEPLQNEGATGHNVTPDASVPAAENGTALFNAPHSHI